MAHTVTRAPAQPPPRKLAEPQSRAGEKSLIEETFAPVAEQMDKTKAGDASYHISWTIRSAARVYRRARSRCNGLLSRSEKHDAGVLTANPPDSTVTVTVQKGSGAGKDLFTMTSGACDVLRCAA